MVSAEDKIVENIIESARSKDDYDHISIEPEAQYNHYGDRGVADLFLRFGEEVEIMDWTQVQTVREAVYEVKSEHAVHQATGANEIIRQFTKMREYFFKDES